METYLPEKGAISAEAAYILSIPKAEIQRLLVQVKDDQSLSEDNKQLYLSFLEAAMGSSDVESYVKFQWKLGRYSRIQLAVWQALASAPAAIMTIPVIWLAIDSFIKHIYP